jgi:hypothetical protein
MSHPRRFAGRSWFCQKLVAQIWNTSLDRGQGAKFQIRVSQALTIRNRGACRKAFQRAFVTPHLLHSSDDSSSDELARRKEIILKQLAATARQERETLASPTVARRYANRKGGVDPPMDRHTCNAAGGRDRREQRCQPLRINALHVVGTRGWYVP